ncbi:MAG: hypothetical protein PHC90_07070 [Syntrophorhabdaceae bacterium]|nr:hypothetical protein [Syntrophorhabdaceae bacterium]
MKENEQEEAVKGIEASLTRYDPENLPCTKLCICDIIRDLPELSAEDIARFQDR